MERETGIEPATSSLGSWRSTAELLPLARTLKPANRPSSAHQSYRIIREAPQKGDTNYHPSGIHLQGAVARRYRVRMRSSRDLKIARTSACNLSTVGESHLRRTSLGERL